MDASMKVTKPKTAGGVCVVELNGEIDVFASPSVKASLLDLIKDGYRLLAVDFARVAYIDSTGLGALIAALKKAREQGGSVAIVCTNPQIRRIFEITGLAKAFAMFDSVDEAVTSLGTSASPAAS